MKIEQKKIAIPAIVIAKLTRVQSFHSTQFVEGTEPSIARCYRIPGAAATGSVVSCADGCFWLSWHAQMVTCKSRRFEAQLFTKN